MDSKESQNNALAQYVRFREVLERLRKDCPWDRKQTWASLRTGTIGEVYELASALIKENDDEVREELGDVFLHIAFYTLIAEEQGKFDVASVLKGLTDKLISRHPHVFGNAIAQTAEDVTKNWEMNKLKENNGHKTVLGGVPEGLPALLKAYTIQGKVKGVGFDWDDVDGAWDKMKEEIAEFQEEVKRSDKDKMEAEFGDILFSLINVARFYKINPEDALERTNRKFTRRFNYLEQKTLKQGRNLKSMTLAEMDEIWDEAKKLEHRDN